MAINNVVSVQRNFLTRNRKIAWTILLAIISFALFLGVFFAGIKAGLPLESERKLASKVAKEFIASCPVTDPGDESARNACGEKLGQSKLLTKVMAPTFVWGRQVNVNDYDVVKNRTMTKFNPFVWRKLYASTFMFTGTFTVEQVHDWQGRLLTVAHIPYKFRNKMDIGSYPYPFWHSKIKWDTYQQSKELLVVINEGKIYGALRSLEQDLNRDYVSREWDGRWHWINKEGKAEPHVTLYSALFSKNNPYVEQLDTAFRELEVNSREYNCATCHHPSNPAKISPLGFMIYPNQTLTMRHKIVSVIRSDRMPPAATIGDAPHNTQYIPPGIADETKRLHLLKLAETFEQTADKALAFEGQSID
ncbi:hypothetical protein G7B40_008800 [Aetokthonos hydrillicola Thurmond2011]|jgi:hypothetical protein|uniref:Uncharacterized protein n=1 Tax=Aetokthonos hydrillicola Thurmond2011 TaxID=2712845 RepID=A0AAP5I413_9CYAN|nr:hypothetical protein [Aetokthonos hydrillicola]MBO3457649.1 hypothetical protein [Aetokthonos hydrillicola CCALA 1050]MBW4587928.1 hypothetical protein [Aetokthonos hydrillicola CCALA 1050]MDR9894667.1 hypothetical protein [Aetokthonos hydrillicola Thurmond2011]